MNKYRIKDYVLNLIGTEGGLDDLSSGRIKIGTPITQPYNPSSSLNRLNGTPVYLVNKDRLNLSKYAFLKTTIKLLQSDVYSDVSHDYYSLYSTFDKSGFIWIGKSFGSDEAFTLRVLNSLMAVVKEDKFISPLREGEGGNPVYPTYDFSSNSGFDRVKSRVLGAIKARIDFSKDSDIAKLIPDRYLKIFRDKDQNIRAVTNVYKYRYEGADYVIGPFEILIPSEVTMKSVTNSELYRQILVKYHNYLNSGIVPKGYVMTNCSDESSFRLHPHIARPSEAVVVNSHEDDASDAWFADCCLGNYSAPINEFLIKGDLYRILIYMSEFLQSLSDNWYTSCSGFTYCKDHARFFKNDCDNCDRRGLCKPVKDYIFKPGVEDFYSTVKRIPAPTEDNPVPWKRMELQSIRGGVSYITPYPAEKFIDGRDPEGFNDLGWDVDGYDRADLDSSGYDREGYDEDGFHRNTGRDREGYDRSGFDINYLDREGNPLPGITPGTSFFDDEEEFADEYFSNPEEEDFEEELEDDEVDEVDDTSGHTANDAYRFTVNSITDSQFTADDIPF